MIALAAALWIVVGLQARAGAAPPNADDSGEEDAPDDAELAVETPGEPPGVGGDGDTSGPAPTPAEPQGAAPGDGEPLEVPDMSAGIEAAEELAESPPQAASAEDDPARCAFDDAATDPLAPLDEALDTIADAGFTVGARESSKTIRGFACATTINGNARSGRALPPDQALLRYVLERTAIEGYVIVLVPTGSLTLEVIARPALGTDERGLLFANVERVSIDGSFLGGDDGPRLREITDLLPGTFSPTWIAAKLQQLGYRADFFPVASGEVIVQVAPGRSIRRVRVHNAIPLSKRDIQRELSVDARPGALAYGSCIEPSKLREDRLPTICDASDLACKQWEKDEIARIERLLFDRGYLRGDARFALVCGRERNEVDLHIYIDKGPAYRVRRKELTIKGNVPTQDNRWIRRTFLPRIKATPFPSRLTRTHIEQAIERSEQRYAEPGSGILRPGATQSALQLPYPDVQVTTSYEDIDRAAVPMDPHLPLTVTIDLGRGVRTSFLGETAFTSKRLLGELSIFRRRESPNAQSAQREAANLRAFLQSKGYLLATVQGRYEEFGQSAPSGLYFVIDQGPKVSIRGVNLIAGVGVTPAVAAEIRREFNRQRTTTRGGSFSEAAIAEDLSALITAYQNRGFPCASAEVKVAFWRDGMNHPGEHAVVDLASILDRPTSPVWAERDFDAAGLAALREASRARLYVRITVDPGPRVFTARKVENVRYLEVPIPGDRDVANLPLATSGQWGAKRMLNRSALRRDGAALPGGIPVSGGLDRDAELDIINNYRGSGFPLADAELRWVYSDPSSGAVHKVSSARRLAEPEVGMCQAYRAGTAVELGAEINVYEGRRGVFGDTLLRGNFKTRDWVLRRELTFKEGDEYSALKVEDSQTNIDGTGVASAIAITPYPVGCELDAEQEACTIHHVVDVREAKDVSMNLTYGLGFATLDPFYLFVRPSFPNLFGTAWDLDLSGHFGFDTSSLPTSVPFLGDCAGLRCYERSAGASLVRQRFLASPLTLQISGQYQQRLTPARGAIVSAIGNIGLTYPITRQVKTYVGYLIQKSNISKDVVKPTTEADGLVVNRRDGIVTDLTGAFQSGVVYTNVEDNPFNPEDGFIASADVMLASPYLGGLDWWFRAETAWQHFIPIPLTDNRLQFRYALRYGHAFPLNFLPGAKTTSIPEVWRYFGGGTVDLGLRGIAPETMLVDVEVIEQGNGVQRLSYTAQGGHIRALASIALQVVSVRDFLGGKLAHSLFFDFGILTQRWSGVDFSRDLRRSVGVNFLKWDIRIVTAALGYAVLIPNAIAPGNVHATDDPNGRFVFDVGITF
ncbi:MAG: BamA/TamA family outer membrane protein [Nannocystaceae bacterium]